MKVRSGRGAAEVVVVVVGVVMVVEVGVVMVFFVGGSRKIKYGTGSGGFWKEEGIMGS